MNEIRNPTPQEIAQAIFDSPANRAGESFDKLFRAVVLHFTEPFVQAHEDALTDRAARVIELEAEVARLREWAAIKHEYEEIAEHYAKCTISPEGLCEWVMGRDALLRQAREKIDEACGYVDSDAYSPSMRNELVQLCHRITKALEATP